MKYWRINSLCNFSFHQWLKTRALDEIKMYLWHREYLCTNFDSDKTVNAPDNKKYTLRPQWDSAGEIFSIFVENKSNWTCSHGLREPQVIRLIEDYFKANFNAWYLLETLSDVEDVAIDKMGRLISPHQIKQKLDEWSSDITPQKPDIVEIGKYNYQQTDIYRGSKKAFASFMDFWISCLYWVNSGEFEANDLLYYKHSNFYNLVCGSCLPVRSEEVKEVLNEIEAKDKKLGEIPLNVYLMRKDWNDRMYVIEYGAEYVMYNWHTAE